MKLWNEHTETVLETGKLLTIKNMETDDYDKTRMTVTSSEFTSVEDIHSCWIATDLTTHCAALAMQHFSTDAHTASNIERAVNDIMAEYGLSMDDVLAMTDHGSNIIAALEKSVEFVTDNSLALLCTSCIFNNNG